jgi:3,4-dehydroadipyl-CoA semialdehyde dehydrogenase
MIQLASYHGGRWVWAGRARSSGGGAGAGGGADPAILVNPATEESLAEAPDGPLDFGAAVVWARERGGPALRALTFRQRGDLLRALSRALHARRDELIALAIANGGNTRADAKFDIDGATGTLAAYADLGQELGDTRVLLDGEAIALGRGARLFGQHVWVSRRGVAAHVNAFNFPAWGLAEKAACALLAGVPLLSKPATSTALVAHRVAQIVVEERILPEGAFSFLCGPGPGLADALGAQDVLAFTGSSRTAASLRGGRAFVLDAARLNVEADSLNAAVLGPDVDPSSELADLFVADVVRDMTQKAGQKCTAIRRVYVPGSAVAAIAERLVDRLRSVRVGDPARDEVGMGPLATAAQLEDGRSGLAALLAGRTSVRVLSGGARPPEVVGVEGARGFFLAPTLVQVPDPAAGDAAHTREIFGPVAILMPYAGAAQAAERVAWGGGGLVGSLYSDDTPFVSELVAAMAPWHGRLVVNSNKSAPQAIPPGTVLPQLVHGGPGRAGGGEELGGRRGLLLYMQRVALQGERGLAQRMG